MFCTDSKILIFSEKKNGAVLKIWEHKQASGSIFLAPVPTLYSRVRCVVLGATKKKCIEKGGMLRYISMQNYMNAPQWYECVREYARVCVSERTRHLHHRAQFELNDCDIRIHAHVEIVTCRLCIIIIIAAQTLISEYILAHFIIEPKEEKLHV